MAKSFELNLERALLDEEENGLFVFQPPLICKNALISIYAIKFEFYFDIE